jgi:UrcA family protein
MSTNVLRGAIRNSAACALAAFGLCLTAPVHAQPYYDNDDAQATTTMGDVTVVAPRRFERSGNLGAPIVRISTSRVVDTSDLDLSNPGDQGVLRDRVQRAAYSACDELDNADTMGMVPADGESTTDCMASAERHALERVGLDY